MKKLLSVVIALMMMVTFVFAEEAAPASWTSSSSRAAPAGRAGPLTETSADAPSELERRMVRPLAEGSENLT